MLESVEQCIYAVIFTIIGILLFCLFAWIMPGIQVTT
jgi:hypothetical protein